MAKKIAVSGEVPFENDLSSKVTTDGKTLSRMLDTLTKATSSLKDMKTVVAASCVMHAIEHGNTTPMNRFLKAVGEGERNDAIVKWAVEFGPFTWKRDPDLKMNVFGYDHAKALVLKEKGNDYAKDLIKTTYWDYVPQKDVPEFNLSAAILSLVKRAEKIESDKTRKANLAGLADLKVLSAKFKPAVAAAN